MDALTKAKIKHKAGMDLLEQVTPIKVLKPRIDRFATVQEGLDELRNLQQEITKVGKFVESAGFTPGKEFQRVARIPPSVWSAVMGVFGDEWDAADIKGKRELFYALLAGPLRDYDIRFKNILT